MDKKIRDELRAKLEIGKGYYFGSTFNGGGYDWDNMNMFDESIRIDVQCWIADTAVCGFQTDVNLYRVSDNELEFTIYASQTSPSWYSDAILDNDRLFEATGLEVWFGKLYEDITWSFEYEYIAEEESSLQLPKNFTMYGIHNESDEDVEVKLNELPPDFKERLTKAMDDFVGKLKIPDGFTISRCTIYSDNDDTTDCVVEEHWIETFIIKL
jgi:hypothetical protein